MQEALDAGDTVRSRARCCAAGLSPPAAIGRNDRSNQLDACRGWQLEFNVVYVSRTMARSWLSHSQPLDPLAWDGPLSCCDPSTVWARG